MAKTVEFNGYTIENPTCRVARQMVDLAKEGDHGADPLGEGMFRMVPSGDVVDRAERDRRLGGV